MQFTLVEDEKGILAALNGRFTFQDHAAFRGLLNAIASAKPNSAQAGTVALDIKALEFIDSAAIGMLLMANDASKKAGLRFVVRSPQGQVRRTLETASLATIFPIQD